MAWPMLTTMYNRASMVLARRRRLEAVMPTADERIAYLEGRFEEHSGSITMLRADFAALRSDVQDLRRHVQSLDQRLSGRIDALDTKLSGRIDALDTKMSRQFTWTIGIQVAMLLAIISALLRVAAT